MPTRTRRGLTLLELLVSIAVVGVLAGMMLPALSAARAAGERVVCASNIRQLQLANTAYATDFDDRYAPAAADFRANLTRWHGARAHTGEPFAPEGGSLSGYFANNKQVRHCPAFDKQIEALAEAGLGFERGCGGYGYNAAYVGLRRGAAEVGGDGSVRRRVVSDLVGALSASFAEPSRTIGFSDAALADGRGPGSGGLIEYSFVEPRFFPAYPTTRADPSAHFRHKGSGKQESGGVASFAWLDGHVSTMTRTYTWSSGAYTGDADAGGVGWPGLEDSNALFDDE